MDGDGRGSFHYALKFSHSIFFSFLRAKNLPGSGCVRIAEEASRAPLAGETGRCLVLSADAK